jgi:shikimate kinase
VLIRRIVFGGFVSATIVAASLTGAGPAFSAVGQPDGANVAAAQSKNQAINVSADAPTDPGGIVWSSASAG